MIQVWTFSPKSGEDKKKGLHSMQLGFIFVRNWWVLFVLTGTFLSDHPALKFR